MKRLPAREVKRALDLAEAATPGEWEVRVHVAWDDWRWVFPIRMKRTPASEGSVPVYKNPHDAEFIAQSRTLIPALAEEVLRLRKELAEAKRATKNQPHMTWVKNDPAKFNRFTDGSVFLVALRVLDGPSRRSRWEFDVVEFDCDGDGASLWYRNKSEIYDLWEWEDFEYFMPLEGEIPTADSEEQDDE